MDRWGWVWVVLVFAPGCTGVESRLFYRDSAQPGWRQEKLRGVPVTVQVASHVKISVIDRRFFYQEDADSMPVEVNARSRGVEYQFIHTSKLFTVDPKRPAAGSSKWSLDLNGQYPKSVRNDVSDLTIQQISLAIEAIAQSGGLENLVPTVNALPASERSAAAANKAEAQRYSSFDSVVATRIFDVEEPGFEDRVREFLDVYVGGCGL